MAGDSSGRIPHLARDEIALALHGVEHRIECPRAEFVAVPGELLDHPLAVEFAFNGMVQDVKPDQAGQQFLMLHPVHFTSDRVPLSNTDNVVVAFDSQ